MDWKALAAFTELGALALISIALIAFLVWIIKLHKSERDEWRKDAKAQNDQTRAVIRDLTNVINGINRSSSM